MRLARIFSIALALACACHIAAHAATLHVPGEYSSVLLAVDAAASGDTVRIGPGTWSDKATRAVFEDGLLKEVTACAFPRSGITIIGDVGAKSTFLTLQAEGTNPHRVISYVAPGPGLLRLTGLTLLCGAEGVGACIIASDCDGVVVRDCLLEGLNATSARVAVAVARGALEMTSCAIRSMAGEVGVVFADECDFRMAECDFSSISGRCVLVENEYSHLPTLIESSRFVGVRGKESGSCIRLWGSEDFAIRGNHFAECVSTLSSGGAVSIKQATGVVAFNVFERDSVVAVGSTGGGLLAQNASIQVTNNTFVGCHSISSSGGSAFTGSVSEIAFTQNVIAYSTGSESVSSLGCTFSGNNCNLFWGNSSGDLANWPPPDGIQLLADPLFCDVAHGDVSVRSDSPCVDIACGGIGALGVGCTVTSVAQLSWARIKSLYR